MTKTAIQCPQWCTEQHDPKIGPDSEDLKHERVVATTKMWGDITLQYWPVEMEGSPSHNIYVSGEDGDLRLDEALDLSAKLAFAANELRKVANGQHDQVFSDTVTELSFA